MSINCTSKSPVALSLAPVCCILAIPQPAPIRSNPARSTLCIQEFDRIEDVPYLMTAMGGVVLQLASLVTPSCGHLRMKGMDYRVPLAAADQPAVDRERGDEGQPEGDGEAP